MKRSLLSLVSLLVVTVMVAAPRTPEQALASARRFMQRQSSAQNFHAPANYSFSIAARSDAYFAVNTGNGFVIVSADDRLSEVLGWSDNGTFDPDNLPPAFSYYLGVYDKELEMVDVSEFSSSPHVASSPQQGTEDVYSDACSPLVSTLWGQGMPYNSYCPESSDSERCPTGCGATAMAQIMKYWEYPVSGTGSHSYSWKCTDCASGYNDEEQTLFADFNTTYDWTNMLNTYPSNNYTSTEAEAVAKLLYHCGVSVEMNYGYMTSYSNTGDIAQAICKYFGYGKDISIWEKSFLSMDTLKQRVHDELAAGRPLIVRGADPETGGHFFICDGFTRTGYFHFNWGWYGTCDGFYAITALNPSMYGQRYHYNDGLQFIGNIHPDPESTTQPMYGMGLDSLSFTPKTGTKDSIFTATAIQLRYKGIVESDCQVGVGLYDLNGNELQIIYSINASFEGHGWGWNSFYFWFRLPSPLADGTYVIDYAYLPNGSESASWTRVSHSTFSNGPIVITVSGESVTMQTPSAVERVTATLFNYDLPYEVYTLGGLRIDEKVSSLSSGAYILRQGNNVIKIVK